MRADKKSPLKSDKKTQARSHKRGVVGYSKKTALLEEAITQMNTGKYGRSSAALKELLALDPHNMEARRLFATLHLRLGSLIVARQAFESLVNEAFERQDYWLAESLLREYLAAGPRYVPFLEKLGALYQEKGDMLEAVAEYGKAIDILIEDPDPDNPQRAAQLFAKIRDLAPASAVALRLAPLFDARTGELLPHTPPIPAETVREESSVTPVEHRIDPAPPSEPVPDELSRERTDDFPVAEGASTVDAVVSAEDGGTPSLDQSVESRELQGVDSVSTTLEPHPVGMIEKEGETDIAQPAAGVADVAPADDPLHSASIEQAPEPVPTADHPINDALADPATEPLVLLKQEETVGAPVPGPMPWEQVQESAIDIPGSVPDSLPTVGAEPDEVMMAPPPGSESAEPIRADLHESQPLASVAPSALEETVSGDQQPVETVSPSPQPDAGAAPPETSKGAGFSWDSVFNTAWRFHELRAPETAQPETTKSDDLVTAEPAATDPHQKVAEPQPDSVSRTSNDQLHPDSGLGVPSVAVAAPMPWEQVQESVITIPPAQLEEPVGGTMGSASFEEPSSERNQTGADQPVVDASPETASCTVSEPPTAPVVPEPEFRFAVAAEPTLSPQSTDASALEAETRKHPSNDVDPFPKSVDREPSSFPIAAAPSSGAVAPTDQESGPSGAFSYELAAEPAPPPIVEKDSSAPVEAQLKPTSFITPITVPIASKDDEPGSLPREEAVPSSAPEPPASPVASVGTALNRDSGVTLRGETVVPAVGEEGIDGDQPPPSTGEAPHWDTGEVAVQPQSPALMKNRAAPVEAEPFEPSRPIEEAVSIDSIGLSEDEPVVAPVEARRPESVLEKEEWIRTGESIRFVDSPPLGKVESAPQASIPSEAPPASPASAAAAVDVLFESSGRLTKTGTRERVVEARPRPRFRGKLSRIRIAISVFIGSCFSTTQAIVTSLVALVLLSGALVAVGIGVIGLAWIVMEEPPSPAFQNLTMTPQRTLSDSKRNGYLLLLGFDAPPGQDPLQAGYERKPDATEADMASACLGGGDGGSHGTQLNASASVVREWFRGADPLGQFKSNQDTIKAWTSQAEPALSRYKQWQKLPFEDWGYGQNVSPPCGAIRFAHQLFVADGFVSGVDAGVDRLEADMEAWRTVLGQAKTLPVKTLALQTINDNIAVASAMLVHPDFDGKHLGRLVRILRPFDQVELSIRWPMQSELVSAAKNFETQLKALRGEDLPLYVAVAARLPLPKQRRFNGYAAYYEASYKAAGEGRYGSLPKWRNYIRFPAVTVLDYLSNPIENIVGLEPLAPWDRYNGLVVDTDAHLRLASLQAWLRRGPQDADLLARIAKAGQNFYDPYTGLPMLVNLKKGVMYSVGHDGKDQEADPQSDVVVAIPVGQTSAGPGKASSTKSK